MTGEKKERGQQWKAPLFPTVFLQRWAEKNPEEARRVQERFDREKAEKEKQFKRRANNQNKVSER